MGAQSLVDCRVDGINWPTDHEVGGRTRCALTLAERVVGCGHSRSLAASEVTQASQDDGGSVSGELARAELGEPVP